MFNLASSVIFNNFIVLERDDSSLWQLEHACQGNFSEMASNAAANLKSLHLLPFDHCGQATVLTRLRTLLS